jgi:phage shock protein E
MNWLMVIVTAAVLAGLFAVRRRSLLPAEKAVWLLREGALVVDVRSSGEFDSGHLLGAVNLPVQEISEAASRRIPDRNRALLLHCRSGMRSGIARQKLRRMGYSEVFNFGSYGRAEGILQHSIKKEWTASPESSP